MPQKSALNSSPSDSPVTTRESSSCTLKCLTTLEAHNSLGHGSNQVHRSLTHMWHLQALPTSTHRLLEPSSLTFRVTSPILGDVSNDLFPLFTHISRRNLYLDSITRLIPTVKVSVHQECILRLAPLQLSQRRVESPPHSSLYSVNWSGIRRSSYSFQNRLTGVQPRSFGRPLLPKCYFCAKHPCPTISY